MQYGNVDFVVTVELRFNESLYNELLGLTNDFPGPNNSKMYGKKPRYNETSLSYGILQYT